MHSRWFSIKILTNNLGRFQEEMYFTIPTRGVDTELQVETNSSDVLDNFRSRDSSH